MQKRGLVAALVIFVMFAMIAAYTFFSYGQLKPDQDKICDGIMVGSVPVGGMTADEAVEAVNGFIAKKLDQLVEIDVNGQLVTASIRELGYTYSAGDFLKQALAVGKNGNMIENYREIKEAEQGKITYPIKLQANEDVIKKFVKKNCKKLCTQAKNSKVSMKGGQFVYTESSDGVSLDVDETVKMIRTQVETDQERAGGENIRITANVKVEHPKVSKETAARCKDKIGTFSTTFNSGNVNRTKNLANAARLINGSVLYPGETFSVHDTISPLTEDNGYYEAASYNNGKVEDSLGGGVCQVSTTLYNAVLRAELEIVARSPHSMLVSYVEPSMDAAIAGDYKDFKFKNNSEVPVYIQGGTYGSTIYFNVYGEETRDSGRKIRFESEVTEEIEPGADKVTIDKTKPESYMTVTQEAHKGCKAILWKIVTENGKETKTQINSSTYSASPRFVTKGGMAKPKETKKPERTERPAATKKPSGSASGQGAGQRSSGNTSQGSGAEGSAAQGSGEQGGQTGQGASADGGTGAQENTAGGAAVPQTAQ